jgi:hypothetical protein
MLECGDTFLAGDTEYDQYHLWIIITPPAAGAVVTVSLTTRRKLSDPLVVIKPGEHPFVKCESVVAYRYASVRHVADIEKAISNGTAIKREKASAEILRRVRLGLLESDFTPIGIRHLYKEFMADQD